MTRERIEGIAAKIILNSPKDCVIDALELRQLCTLALRGLPPKVAWVRAAEDSLVAEEHSADWGQFRVVAWKYFTEAEWRWDLVAFDENKDATESLKSGTADSLEAAQKAAEDALLKLVGGEG